MDKFRGQSINVAGMRASLIAYMFVLASSGAPVFAREAVLQITPQAEESSKAASDNPPADHWVEETTGQVYRAAPVGTVSFGRTADIAGSAVFYSRSQLAGSAAVVSFSSAPPRMQSSSSGAGKLQMPISVARVTGRFGERRSRAGGGTRMHAGVDFAAPEGSPVAAASDGRVSAAGWSGGYGLLVVLDHGNGLQTRYAHLSRLSVSAGQTVGRGDLIGLVGSTGRSTGPHLHYEVRHNGQPVSPHR